MNGPLLIVDVAHPSRSPRDVEDLLLEAWGKVRNSTTLRGLKIIHGYGSSGSGGSTRELVRNWAFRHRGRFRMIIYGEVYGIDDASTQELRQEVGQFADSDLDGGNPGVTIVWVK